MWWWRKRRLRPRDLEPPRRAELVAAPPDDGHSGSFTRPEDVLMVNDGNSANGPDLHWSPEEGVQKTSQEVVHDRRDSQIEHLRRQRRSGAGKFCKAARAPLTPLEPAQRHRP